MRRQQQVLIINWNQSSHPGLPRLQVRLESEVSVQVTTSPSGKTGQAFMGPEMRWESEAMPTPPLPLLPHLRLCNALGASAHNSIGFSLVAGGRKDRVRS